MRTYAPADVASVLAGILDEPSLARGVLHHAVEPARDARSPCPSPAGWTRGSASALAAARDRRPLHPPGRGPRRRPRGPRRLRRDADGLRQEPLLRAAGPPGPGRRSRPPAPSGSSRPRRSAQDQVVGLPRAGRRRPACPSSASTYDGDTPAPIRSTIRTAGQVVVTNPDMLHAAILPHHTKWFQLFEQVRVIVVDELHTYRGLFGSHVANVLRRLLRLCAHYGSHPVIVTCSATIANPGELAELLTGRAPLVVDRNGAPSGERHLLFVDPPVIDAASGARGSALRLAQRWALPFIRAGRQTIVFGPSRTGVEVILSGLREIAAREPRPAHPGARLPRRLPADGAAGDRGRASRRRGPRRREHQRARARCGHRAPRRGDPGRLPGLDRGHPAADRAGGPPPRHERRRPRRLGGARGPVRRPPPGVPARPCRPRRPASIRTTCTSCSPT